MRSGISCEELKLYVKHTTLMYRMSILFGYGLPCVALTAVSYTLIAMSLVVIDCLSEQRARQRSDRALTILVLIFGVSSIKGDKMADKILFESMIAETDAPIIPIQGDGIGVDIWENAQLVFDKAVEWLLWWPEKGC